MISRLQGNDCLSLNVNPNLLTPFKSFSLPQLDLCVHPLRIVAASRVARSASQHEETLWRKGPSAAVLAFFLLTASRSPKLLTASRSPKPSTVLRPPRPEYFLIFCFASRATHRGFG